MKRYAIALVLGVIITHRWYNEIGQFAKLHPAVVFYAAVGNLLALLCLVLWDALKKEENTIWKLAVYVALGVGISEGLMMNCVLFGPATHGQNLCDEHTGLPVGFVANGLAVIITAWRLGKNARYR